MPRWLRLLLSAVALLFAASFVFSRALRLSAARRYLTAHLAASFGRPVDVSWFDFSLLDGARVEAHQVTVSEDPHFGNEYFLRADTVTAGLRWSSLLAGRFEFGSVRLSRPSLNLVRDAGGQWNIERWLPPAPQPTMRSGFVGPVPPSPVRATRPARIDIEDGRVNFKRGDNKLSFAMVDVAGTAAQDGSGHWQLDLEARPMRAGIQLQDIGTVRLRGSIGGTTARLQPAEVTLAWRSASLADTLRLLSQNDYGIRGELDVDLTAHIGPARQKVPAPAPVVEVRDADHGGAQWTISGVARVAGIHGWRLVERASDPAVNLSVDLDWRLGDPRLQIRALRVDMAASHLEGAGEVDWSRGVQPELRVANSTVALSDALAWYKALHPGVAEDLQPAGTLGLDLKLSGWPLQLEEGAITSAGGTLATKTLPALLQLGALRASVSRGKVDLAPVEVSLAPAPVGARSDAVRAASAPRNAFAIRGSVTLPPNGASRWPSDWNVSIEGATSRVQDWLALSAAFGQPINSGWSASGGLAVKMRRARSAGDSAASPWTGTMDFLALALSPSYVNQPVMLPKAHIEFAPTQRTVTLAAASAFGTAWRGSIARKYSDEQWSFDLTADHLDALELDRWLGPRARPGFLARIIGSDTTTPSGPVADAPVTRLAAGGRLRAGSISVPPILIEKFDGQAELAGRTIQIRGGQGDFFGGRVLGSLEAQLLREPSYEFQGHFDRVDLAQLGRAVPSLSGRIAGIASATLNLSAHGIGRDELTGSLEGDGTLNGRNLSLRGIDFSTAANLGSELAGAPESFAALRGSYHIRNRSVELADFVLDRAGGQLVADGRVGFSRALNVRIRSFDPPASASDPPQNFLLGGTLEAPTLVLGASVSKPQVRTR